MTEPLLGAREIRELAESLGIRPTKKLGQNFVIDPNTVQRIVRAAQLRPDDLVLEVGPGLGSLTLALLEQGHRVTAVEIDPSLAQQLPITVAEHQPDHAANLEVITHDALTVTEDVVTWRHNGPPTALVANLPYNVAVPVLLHLLEILPSIRTVLVMVQKEVADRLAAEPGSRTYGVPSVKARWYGTVEYAGSIGPKVFWPEPNVDSGLVRITKGAPPAGAPARERVFAVVDAAFGQRRKALRGALAGVAGSVQASEAALERAGISPMARGESLDVGDFARLAAALDH